MLTIIAFGPKQTLSKIKRLLSLYALLAHLQINEAEIVNDTNINKGLFTERQINSEMTFYQASLTKTDRGQSHFHTTKYNERRGLSENCSALKTYNTLFYGINNR